MLHTNNAQTKLQRMTLVSDLASNHNAIPSPQYALGTTPHLCIRKKAREGREMKERRGRKKRGAGRKMFRKKTAEDVKDNGGGETER